MAWNEHIHIHIHNEDTNQLLQQILDELKKKNEVIPQEIMDKLDAAIADLKSTI